MKCVILPLLVLGVCTIVATAFPAYPINYRQLPRTNYDRVQPDSNYDRVQRKYHYCNTHSTYNINYSMK